MKKRKMRFGISLLTALTVLVSGFYFGDCDIPHVAVKAETKDDGQVVGESYQKKQMIELLKKGKLKSDREGISIKEDKQAQGVIISGSKDDVEAAKFLVDEDFDFDSREVSRFSLDAIVERKKEVEIEFFLDDESEAFLKVGAERMRKSKDWKFKKELTYDISKLKIKGKHRLSYRIKPTGSDKNVKILIRSFEFAANTGLPVLYFDIDERYSTINEMNSDPQHKVECFGNMKMQIPKGYKSEYSEETASDTTDTVYELDYIRGRGNSTWSADKKPYKIKLDKAEDLLGMGKNKHWVLLANRYDNSKLRNKISYWLGEKMGMEFTPQSEFVDVVMNGRYMGSYYLCEHIRVGKSRVDIDDLNGSDESRKAVDEPTITGGYLLGLEGSDERRKHFNSKRNDNFEIESPSFEEYYNPVQYNYIKNYVNRTEDSIYGKNFRDSKGNHYSNYIDVASAINYYWIQEFSLNGDAMMSTSSYLYKKRDIPGNRGKLFFGPLWDFDFVAWGAIEYGFEATSGFSIKDRFWYERLFQNRAFADKAVKRWQTLKKLIAEAVREGGQLDRYAEKLKISEYYDLQKWGMFDFSDSQYGNSQAKSGNTLTFDQEVSRLKNWMKDRNGWVDKNIKKLYPKWIKLTYRLGKKVFAKREHIAGSEIKDFPRNPVDRRSLFMGWYYKVRGKEYKLSYNKKLYSDTTLYAKWKSRTSLKKAKYLYLQTYKINLSLTKEDKVRVPHSVLPSSAWQGVKWISNNPKIAKISKDGLITALKQGKTKMIASTSSGKKQVLHVTVYKDHYLDFRFKLSRRKLRIKRLYMGKITPTVLGSAPYSGFIFKSLDPDIASVNSAGLVYARKPGVTYIVIKDGDEISTRYCRVEVSKR